MFEKMKSMFKSTKGELTGIAKGIVYGLVGIVVALTVARYMLPEVVHAGNNVSALNLPFSSHSTEN